MHAVASNPSQRISDDADVLASILGLRIAINHARPSKSIEHLRHSGPADAKVAGESGTALELTGIE